MKIIALMLTLCWFTQITCGQTTYKGLPVIKAKSKQADYRVDNDWVNGNWTISPHIEFDSLPILCHTGSVNFAFFTDLDSITFKLAPGQVHKFYVSLADTAYALTVVKGAKPTYTALRLTTKSKNSKLNFCYEQNKNNEYLNLLRSEYPVDSLARGERTDAGKALKILHWVHNQWQHNGDNEPRKNDALSILEEVRQGKNFRCVEYAIVAAACLNASGLKARRLGLMTKDVETRQS
jgi:hypothetical protein